MTRDPRFDILFEPIKIGPVTAPNRFYQVPHCNGMGRVFPDSMIAMRGMKAAGGWGIVCTEQCDFHPSADITPFTETRMWDDADIGYLAGMVNAVHEHGSLAGIELVHNGHDVGNLYSREVPIGPSHRPVEANNYPGQARAMDKQDIRDYRRWHRNAALRSKKAGFDLVVVYHGHDGTVPTHFLSKRQNQRTDEYGGSLENRLRLYRELLEETKEAVGDTMGVIARFAVDEMMGSDGLEWQNEGRDALEMLAELPDMWDVNVSDWANDSMTSRFAPEGYQEEYVRFVKQLTTKPVSTVGRYTSPDAMVSAIRHGIVDLIGAARPSIADPYLPRKIEEGRPEDIRECIGCNICVAWDMLSAPIRCTQNPTMGEEWRKGWHPEQIAEKTSHSHVLVVGSGPAGLEAAHQLGKRGYRVTLAEAGDELGGRVTRESQLPGLAAWARVRDYRLGQIQAMVNVETFLDSELTAEHVLEFGADHVCLATGATWRHDGVGRANRSPIPGMSRDSVLSPDDIMDGNRPAMGPVVVFDDDHYYLGGVIAELLSAAGYAVTIVTPETVVADWTRYTLEQRHIEESMKQAGVAILTRRNVVRVSAGEVVVLNALTDQEEVLPGSIVSITMRLPNDDLYNDLMALGDGPQNAGIKSIRRIGDCYAPSLIASA
ncbi:MAG: FAD-dependent oxidoreductase, partial [Alphaproteobacteria bacterium]|nr:FAD-dependent oxidoreductase [Alphaproteobacteria bacterium]